MLYSGECFLGSRKMYISLLLVRMFCYLHLDKILLASFVVKYSLGPMFHY